MKAIVVDALLGLAVLTVLASSVGILVMRDVYQKLHYVTPAAMVAPLILWVAILVQSGWSTNSAQTWLALLFLVLASPFVTHATIRAARIREKGDWRPGKRRDGSAGSGPAQERP